MFHECHHTNDSSLGNGYPWRNSLAGRNVLSADKTPADRVRCRLREQGQACKGDVNIDPCTALIMQHQHILNPTPRVIRMCACRWRESMARTQAHLKIMKGVCANGTENCSKAIVVNSTTSNAADCCTRCGEGFARQITCYVRTNNREPNGAVHHGRTCKELVGNTCMRSHESMALRYYLLKPCVTHVHDSR
jgi:hypothetical protein